MIRIVFSFLVLLSVEVFAEENSRPFLLGEADSPWGLDVSPDKDGSLKLRLGARLHTVISQRSRKDSTTGDRSEFQDSYIRRGRFQFEAAFKEGLKFYMDVRNDNANKEDQGEGTFNIGDAYVEASDVFKTKGLKFRAFRAKVDVSRTETISSSEILFLDRTFIADEAAQFVSHNRRASNVQLLGAFDKWYFQAVAGDGVQKGSFNDAKGKNLSTGAIDSQKFMIGGKLKFYPFSGWEDRKPSETYFGEGQHFSVGSGVFHTGGIEYRNSSGTQVDRVSRTLTNVEMSFHIRNLSFQTEYFHFNGVIEDFSAASKNAATSDGFYAHGEYVFPSLSYVAPFVRYEKWDRFKKKSDYELESHVAGINWYLKGNKIRVGLAYQYDKLDSNLRSTNGRGQTFEDDRQIKLTSMWHF